MEAQLAPAPRGRVAHQAPQHGRVAPEGILSLRRVPPEGIPGVDAERAPFLVQPAVDGIGQGRDPGLDHGDPSSRPEDPRGFGEECGGAGQVVHEVQAHHRVEASRPEGQPQTVGHHVVPRRLQELGGHPGDPGPAPARVGGKEAGAGPHLDHTRSRGQALEQRVEPDRVHAGQHGLALPDAPVLDQPGGPVRHTNFSLRAANRLMRASSQPCRKREMLVWPYCRSW